MRFYVGLHQVHHAYAFTRCMISINRLKRRKADFLAQHWMLDSGAFTELARNGRYLDEPEAYAQRIQRWASIGRLDAAVTQDYMCEPFMLERTGLTVAEHQRLTIERYDRILAAAGGTYILPVLQGYAPAEYVEHIRMYGCRLWRGMWVGVGSVCKRNATPRAILEVLEAIHTERPDLALHGFGVKHTALVDPAIRRHFDSSDSMAWSFAARYEGRDQNSADEAHAYINRIRSLAA